MPEFLAWLLANGHPENLALRYVKVLGDMLATGVAITDSEQIQAYRLKAPKYHQDNLKHVLNLFSNYSGNTNIPILPKQKRAVEINLKLVPEADLHCSAFLYLLVHYFPQLTDRQIQLLDSVKHCSPTEVRDHHQYRSISLPESSTSLNFRISVHSRSFFATTWKTYWQRTILLNRDPGVTRLFVSADEDGTTAPTLSISTLRTWRSLLGPQDQLYQDAADKSSGFECEVK